MPEKLKKADEAHVKQPVEVEHIKPKIPEQMMKEKLEKISKNKIEFYEGILKRMNFEVNAENILILHKVYEAEGAGKMPVTTMYRIQENTLPSLANAGVIKKTSVDLEKRTDELIDVVFSFRQAGLFSDYAAWNITNLADKGVIKPQDKLKDYGDALLNLGLSSRAADFSLDYIFWTLVPSMADSGLVTPDDFKKYGDALLDGRESFLDAGFSQERISQTCLTLQKPILSLVESRAITSPNDLTLILRDLAKNPHVIDSIQFFSKEELSQLKPQNFSAQLIELASKKITEFIVFPLEKITQSQKEHLVKMLSGMNFIEENEEVQMLIKHGLKNTFQQHYDSLEENKKALQEMKKLGINTKVFVFHQGIEDGVFKKTLTGIERLEAGEEHIKDTFNDVTMQLFNNPKGEVFKKPGKVFAETTQIPQFDAREYKTGEQRTKALIEMMQSNDETWLKGALSVLERYLKTMGTPGSVLLDSDVIKQEAKTALFHVQELERLAGLPVKPLKGEKGEITISIRLTDKNPLTALTNGNDSGCCVAINGGNNWTLPVYMKDMATQIAEIFITKEGKEQRIGQAWLFAGKNYSGDPALIIDSINITSAYKNMNEIYEASIEFIKDYAEKAGFKNIVMGTNYNDAYPYAVTKFEKGQVSGFSKIHTFERFYSDALRRGSESEPSSLFFVKL